LTANDGGDSPPATLRGVCARNLMVGARRKGNEWSGRRETDEGNVRERARAAAGAARSLSPNVTCASYVRVLRTARERSPADVLPKEGTVARAEKPRMEEEAWDGWMEPGSSRGSGKLRVRMRENLRRLCDA
jgi:hypothetical protein